MMLSQRAWHHSLLLSGVAVFAGGTWFLLTWCKQRKLAQRENAIAKIFAEVKALNKAITMVVSDASSSSFSRRNLSKYLLQRGLGVYVRVSSLLMLAARLHAASTKNASPHKESWYCTLKGFKQGSKPFSVMNAFVTKYRPLHGEDELQKHIDTRPNWF
eukprot:g17499.t1